MEWVEITGRTIEEAKEAALDQLGVDTDDAEFEILEEPKQGLFGRVRGQARVRARIRPTQPRPKVERRDRRRRGGSSSKAETESVESTGDSTAEPEAPASTAGTRSPRRSGDKGASSEKGERPVSDQDVDLQAHTAIVTEFVTGLVEAFGYEGQVESELLDEEYAEVRVEGADLGLMVGPKGNTLTAIQELSRTVVHRRVPGTAEGRVRLDVAGYRQRRREALERFTQSVADEVRDSGVQKALEPMNPADRKVVHDTVNDIGGVTTISEGEEPRRRVVVVPE
ncbi:MAG TPA: RNA-binding cell elongation regulator Jag/EloR [Acidimicrobiales bacterium]